MTVEQHMKADELIREKTAIEQHIVDMQRAHDNLKPNEIINKSEKRGFYLQMRDNYEQTSISFYPDYLPISTKIILELYITRCKERISEIDKEYANL